MANWAVGTVTYNELSAAPSATGFNTGKFWFEDVLVGQAVFDRRRIALPGVNGFRIKKFGSRGTPVVGRVAYIAAAYTTVFTDMQADRAALVNSIFSMTPPQGTIFAKTELVDFPQNKVFILGDGKYLMMTTLSVYNIE